MDSNGENMHLVNYMGEVLEHCEACHAFARAPHVPIAGTIAVAMSGDKSQVYLSFSAPHVMDAYLKYAL